jgi:pilus assembly protein FimV
MPVNTRPRVVSFALKTLSSAVACAVLLSPAAQGAGLGKLTVLSSLGQPLKAEIELTAVSSEETDALVAKLAPADAFKLANIEFSPSLLSLRFSVEQRNGRQFIRISSSQPVNEPFVDMLLELSWNSGRLVREYTFLLDPAEIRQTQPAQVAAPVEVPSARAAAPAPAASEPAPERAAPRPGARTRGAVAENPAAPSEYRVKSGDSLSRIASRTKPAEVSLDVMLAALYRANPNAFSGKNMNRLRSGQILALPDAAALAAVPEGEAQQLVVAHAADFSAYRSKLAGQVAQSTPAKAPEEGQSAGGKISAKVEERATPANASKDQLKLSKATAAAPVAGKTAQAGIEDKIAKEKQVAEAAARVKELEKNVSDLEKLMAVKSKAAAELKKPEPAPAAPAEAAKAAPAAASASASAPEPAKPTAAKAAASESASAASTAPVKPKPKIKPAPVVVVPEPSILDAVFDNIGSVGIALAALLAGVGALVASRRKKKAPAKDKDAPVTQSELDSQAPSLFAEAGGQSVDTNSVFNSNFAPSASQLDTNEVDPVAEADVYIAYGRDAQAEEILKEALRTHPERHPVRLKLLEIYAARKDARSFETQAGELYSMTKGEGDEWQQAAALGLSIDAHNPLYAGGAAAPAATAPGDDFVADMAMLDEAPQAPVAAPANLDFDLGQDAPAAAAGLDFAIEAESPAEPAMPTPASVAAEADAEHFLDFDLGGLSFEPPSLPDDHGTAAAPAAAPEPKPEPESLAEPAFDMTFDLPDDFSIDAPAKAEPKVAEVEPEAEALVAEALPDPLSDLDLTDFDLPESIEEAPAPAVEAAAAPAEIKSAAPEFDLSDIDLDLGLPDFDAADAAEATATPAKPAAAGALSALHMEMETKLDLAVAYQEIGDKEGARELIDEVIKDGNEDQVAKALAMHAALG